MSQPFWSWSELPMTFKLPFCFSPSTRNRPSLYKALSIWAVHTHTHIHTHATLLLKSTPSTNSWYRQVLLLHIQCSVSLWYKMCSVNYRTNFTFILYWHMISWGGGEWLPGIWRILLSTCHRGEQSASATCWLFQVCPWLQEWNRKQLSIHQENEHLGRIVDSSPMHTGYNGSRSLLIPLSFYKQKL